MAVLPGLGQDMHDVGVNIRRYLGVRYSLICGLEGNRPVCWFPILRKKHLGDKYVLVDFYRKTAGHGINGASASTAAFSRGLC